jgi:predicted peroxiredoxin
MTGKAVISLTTGLEDPERVTVAFLVEVGAAEQGRPSLVFLSKEAVRLAIDDVATGIACEGCPPLPDLQRRFADADGRYFVCPICFDAKSSTRATCWSTQSWPATNLRDHTASLATDQEETAMGRAISLIPEQAGRCRITVTTCQSASAESVTTTTDV